MKTSAMPSAHHELGFCAVTTTLVDLGAEARHWESAARTYEQAGLFSLR
jgi:hypothetical protein